MNEESVWKAGGVLLGFTAFCELYLRVHNIYMGGKVSPLEKHVSVSIPEPPVLGTLANPNACL